MRLLWSTLLVIVLFVLSPKDARADDNFFPGFWVEAKQDLIIKMYPHVNSSDVVDSSRPSLEAEVLKGQYLKVVNTLNWRYLPEGCLDDNCIWYQLSYGWVHSSRVKLIASPTQPEDINCPEGIHSCSVVLTQMHQVHVYIDNKWVGGTYVSTGLLGTPTNKGLGRIFQRTVSQNMIRPAYQLYNVAYNSFFNYSGEALHGCHWHHKFGTSQASHGCVNMEIPDAKAIFEFFTYGDVVVVY